MYSCVDSLWVILLHLDYWPRQKVLHCNTLRVNIVGFAQVYFRARHVNNITEHAQ